MVGGAPPARIGHIRGVVLGSTANITELSRHGKSIGFVRALSLAECHLRKWQSFDNFPLLRRPAAGK